jgi:hypothetical protein
MRIIDNFLSESTLKIHLFLDLDSVLVDFMRGVEQLGYGTFKEIESTRGPNFIWKILSREGESFWKNLEWMPDGKQLYKFCEPFHPTILSAPTRDHTSRTGKEIWVRQQLGPNVKLILERAKDKYKHAKPGYILVDDMKPNIDGWINAGGIGILHTSAEDTISKLQKIIKG